MYEYVRQHLSKAPCFYELQGHIDIHLFCANADLKDPLQFMDGSCENFLRIQNDRTKAEDNKN